MSVGDERRDPGDAWILLTYHQYKLPLCFRATGRNILVTNL